VTNEEEPGILKYMGQHCKLSNRNLTLLAAMRHSGEILLNLNEVRFY
jgi:hypothetical protein